MSKVTFKIGTKTHDLKFGYGVFKRLASAYNLQDYTAIGELLTSLKFGETKTISFEQLDFVGRLIKAAIEYNLGDEIPETYEDIVELVQADPEGTQLEKIMQAFANSVPKADDRPGKSKRASKKQPV